MNDKIKETILNLINDIKFKEKEILQLKERITKTLISANDLNSVITIVDFIGSGSCSESIPRLEEKIVELKALHNKKQMLEYILK